MLVPLLMLGVPAASTTVSSYPNWRDLPVGADTITMLDGDDWTATGAGRAFSKNCTGGSTAGPE